MSILKKCIFLLISVYTVVNTLSAQTSSATKPGTVTKITTFKPPVVKTFLGRNSQTAEVTLEEANQLINLPLKITDDKNNVYAVSSYQFLYKKRGVKDNLQTGKQQTVFTTIADLFKVTPLPKIWRDNIGGNLQKGEELYFFDILVKDKLDRKFYAPELKIIVR